jgi:hypothetical protein
LLIPQIPDISYRQRVRFAVDGNKADEVLIQVMDPEGLAQIVQTSRAFDDAQRSVEHGLGYFNDLSPLCTSKV